MGEYAIGSKPSVEFKQVDKDYEVKQNDICYYTLSCSVPMFFPPGSWDDRQKAEEVWSNISQHGDEPLYVRIKTDWFGSMMMKFEAEIALKHTSGSTPIHLILFGVAAVLLAAGFLLSIAYYVATGKSVELPTGTGEALTAIAMLAGIAVVGYIVYKIVVPEYERGRRA